ncbi:MAG: DEAD/DEAH box helicase family protein [Candidatus Aenigmarchaeota archaeon]|nr:DEAD/DEAH box helicase family protein [Candidatus Aenigmarchaeota archaeon]
MPYIEHPLIKPNSIESRVYQEKILATAINKNTLVVLPTGLGKTALSAMVVAHTLQNRPDKRILFLAPTRPLVNQHKKSFEKFFNLPDKEMEAITGFIDPIDREFLYRKKIIFATPQVVKNDIVNGSIDMENFSLLILDEVHRARGAYAYSGIAQQFLQKSNKGRILALTASPGSSKEKINQMCAELGIEAVEIRLETDADVAPYVKEKEVEWVFVELPKDFEEIRGILKNYIEKRAKKIGIIPGNMSKGRLIELQRQMQDRIRRGDKSAFHAVSTIAELLKVEHALEMVESQGISALTSYMRKMAADAEEGKTRAVKRIMEDDEIKLCVKKADALLESGVEHPKMGELVKIIGKILIQDKEAKVIIFSNYRNTVIQIFRALEKTEGARPISFIGQSTRNDYDEGLTQTEQAKRLELFRSGHYNCLIGTSISEEGLDIPAVDVAIFYEPIASEIRSIQRRGRVGRSVKGKIFVLIAQNTRDEAYYWSAHHKERRMKTILTRMQGKDLNYGRGLNKWAKNS